MCRSIKTLRRPDDATEQEVYEAALQYVRKISGYRTPSRKNAEVFERAVSNVEHVTRQLLDELRAGQTSEGETGR